jgi:hypothetical protein
MSSHATNDLDATPEGLGRVVLIAPQRVDHTPSNPDPRTLRITVHEVRSEETGGHRFEVPGVPLELSSLSVYSHQRLNVELFRVENLHNLRDLYFSGIKISHTTLLSIIEASAATLQNITFIAVDLRSGLWEDIFKALQKLQNLLTCKVEEGEGRAGPWVGCSYDRNGDSAEHWAPHNRSFGTWGLCSQRRDDIQAFQMLTGVYLEPRIKAQEKYAAEAKRKQDG